MSGGNLFVTGYNGGGRIGEYNATTGATVNASLVATGSKNPFGIAVVSTPLPGDYNDNGVVDAADYTVWRDSLGSTGTNLAADGNDNNAIDAGDYNVWKTNFGNHSGMGASANAGVPEPASIALTAMGALGLIVGGLGPRW